jgi:hypothetical protein
MPSESLPNEENACELEAAIDQAIAACDGDLRDHRRVDRREQFS